MDAAECRANTCVLLDEVDAALEVVAAKQDVIERIGYAMHGKRDARSQEGNCSQSEESSPRDHRITFACHILRVRRFTIIGSVSNHRPRSCFQVLYSNKGGE